MPKLTVRTVESVKPVDGERFVWDAELPGFGLRVQPSGVRTFLVQYRANGRTRRFKLGRYGALAPEEARRRAKRVLADVSGGSDPSADRRAGRGAPTVRDLCSRYLRDVAELHSKPTYLAQQKRMVEKRLLPKLGAFKVASVTRADVAELHNAMRETPYEANRVLALIGVMFKHAELWRWRDEGTNPARLLKRYKERRRERLLSDAEVGRIYATLAEAERTVTEAPSVILAIRLLFATACRASEILGLRWEYFSEQTTEIILPDTKTGGMRKPLTAEVRRLVDKSERIVGNPFVCTGIVDRSGPLNMGTLEHAWRRILKRAEVPHCGLHAIRHRAATDIANSGVPIHVGMALTGHRAFETFRRYLHTERQQVSKAAEDIAKRRRAIVAKSTKTNAPARIGQR